MDALPVITVHYRFQQPTLQDTIIAGTTYQEILMTEDITCYGAPGEPVLPQKQVELMLPLGTTVHDIIIEPSDPVNLGSGFTILPGETPIQLSADDVVSIPIPNPQIYSSTQPLPTSLYSFAGVQYFRGMPFAILSIYPIQYTPDPGSLTFYPELTVTITVAAQPIQNQLYRGLATDIQEATQKADNRDDGFIIDLGLSSTPRDYSLLIITTNALRPGFQRLAQAHNRQGLPTLIQTLGTNIPYGNTTNQTCENIRDFIRTAYQQLGIDSVLLGGDIDVIPAPYLFFGPALDFVWYNVSGPSDFYYSCLDGPYNSDGDDRWGESTDGENGSDVDLLAEVYVGRTCVENLTEVGHFVNKTLRYMITPAPSAYSNKVLMVGALLDDEPLTWGGDYMDQLIDTSTDSNYITHGIPSNEYAITKLYDRDWEEYGWPQPSLINNGGWPKWLLLQEMCNGTYIVNNLGHSSTITDMKLSIQNVTNLTNRNLLFIYSQGCFAGSFDMGYDGYLGNWSDCIAEYYTVKSEFGAFAGIWNTRYGWVGPSQHFHRWFWDAVFNDGKTVISQAHQDSKEDNIGLIHGDQMMRFCCYEATYLGDPTLSFHLQLHATAHGPYEGIINAPIQFTGTVVGGTPPYRFFWNFSDGTTSKNQNPLKTFQATGEYTATFTVTDATGKTYTNQTNITIADKLQVDPHGPYLGVVNLPVQFTGSISGGFSPYTFSWDFGDNSSSGSLCPSHEYTATGTYQVTFTVTDRNRYNQTKNTTVTIFLPPSEVWVDDDFNESTPGWGYTHYSVISRALTAVTDDGFVNVLAGEYLDGVSIVRPVHLIGVDASETIIDAHYNGPCVSVYAPNVSISGFTLHHSNPYAIYLVTATGCRITGNILDGIDIENTEYVTIQDNDFLLNGVTIVGDMLSQWNTHTIERNTMNNARIYYYVNSQQSDQIPLDAGQVILANCSNITLSGLTFDVASYAVQVGFCNRITIEENMFTGIIDFMPQAGIFLCGSSDNTIRDNTISGYFSGMLINSFSNNNLIVGNTIHGNSNEGISLYLSFNQTIVNNSLSQNMVGISQYFTSENHFIGNQIYDNYEDGVYLWLVGDNEFIGNTIANNIRFNLHAYSASNLVLDHNVLTGGADSVYLREYSDNAVLVNNQIGSLFVEMSPYATIRNNTFVSKGITLKGTGLSSFNTHTIEQNTLNSKPIYYYANIKEPTTVPLDAGQVILANCSNVTIQNLTLQDTWIGVQLAYATHNTITHNTLVQNEFGLWMISSSDNTVSANLATENCIGMRLQQSQHNVFVDNTFRYNFQYGLWFEVSSSSNDIYHNNFIDNYLANAWTEEINIWNLESPIGGNYWSDYQTQYPDPQDLNQDGFWDQPYYVYGYTGARSIPNYDYLPFVNENGWR